MSIKLMSMVWDLPLRSNEKIVLLAIADHANDEGFAYPGYDRLEKKCGISRATLAKTIKFLSFADLVTITQRAEIGVGKKSSLYQIIAPKSITPELIDKIAQARRKVQTLKSSVAELRKVQTLNANSSNTEQEPPVLTTSIESSVISAKKNFKAPTIDEVAQYCVDRKNKIDPCKFINYYEATNWFRGKTKIKNWKACVRTWEQNSSPGPSGPGPSDLDGLSAITRKNLKNLEGDW